LKVIILVKKEVNFDIKKALESATVTTYIIEPEKNNKVK